MKSTTAKETIATLATTTATTSLSSPSKLISDSDSSAYTLNIGSDVVGSQAWLRAQRYRGAAVEDLQLPPALSVTASSPIGLALVQAYERDYTHLTVVSAIRKPIGYVKVPDLVAMLESGKVSEKDGVELAMTRLPNSMLASHTLSKGVAEHENKNPNWRPDSHPDTNAPADPNSQLTKPGLDTVKTDQALSSGDDRKKYQIITPATPLADLEVFFYGENGDPQLHKKEDVRVIGRTPSSSERTTECAMATTNKAQTETQTNQSSTYASEQLANEGGREGSQPEFAIVTDPNRVFVLGIATREDLREFLRRRPPMPESF